MKKEVCLFLVLSAYLSFKNDEVIGNSFATTDIDLVSETTIGLHDETTRYLFAKNKGTTVVNLTINQNKDSGKMLWNPH